MGVICNSGIRFILGWHDLSKDDVMKKMNKLCNNLEVNASERCWNCPTHLSTCIVKDDTYGLHLWINNRSEYLENKFYNFQLTYDEWHNWGWVIEYQLDCGELDGIYWRRIRSEHTIADKAIMVKVAERVCELLDFTEFTLIPYPFADTWRG
jgi:hypothetical protein